jgi:hypothetical protein
VVIVSIVIGARRIVVAITWVRIVVGLVRVGDAS